MTTPGLPIGIYIIIGAFTFSILIGIPVLIVQIVNKNLKHNKK